MKSAGKARNNGLYRHIRTSKEIIRNLLNDYNKHYITEVKKLNKFCQKSYRTFFQCTDNVFLAYNGKEK